MSPPEPSYRFGAYEVRTRTRELYKNASRIRLRPQAFLVLQALVEHPDNVVTREELRQLLWPAETFVDFEHGLNNAIKELRAALSDSPSEPRYIETLPKLGYRMIVPVESGLRRPQDEAPPEPEAPSSQEAQVAPVTKESPAPAQPVRARRRWLAPAVAAALVAIVGFATYARWSRVQRGPQPTGERMMLAVLPFENLTGDPAQDYFSDGLTEEMIAQLGRLDPRRLGVIGRTSVMHYKHSQEQLPQIGSELGVQYVLEGTVRRDAQNVRISAQLIQVKDQTHLWSRQYDRQLSSLLTLQAEIAREAADEIELTLGQHSRAAIVPRTPAPAAISEAYDLYLKGQYFWNKRTVQGFQQAIEYFQQAIARDSNYAPAYAGLADSYTLLTGYSGAPATQFMPQARAAALRALELDANLPEAHTALALIVQNYEWDWQTAEKEYRRAVALNPNYATAHQWYAEHLMWQGRFAEALAESELARRLEPLSLIIATDNGAILYFSRQYDRAIEKFRAVQELDPDFPRARIVIYAYVETGRFQDALADIAKVRQVVGDELWTPWSCSRLAYVYGRSGQQEQARRALRRLEDLNRRQHVDPEHMAWAYAGLGDKDRCMGWLEKAWAQHSNIMTGLKVEPGYDFLRDDPRFQDLLRRVHLSP
jgi:TolB-like protein/DNA-binding winged helix-turn-helix (wHTH) protein/Tfp pilus assembly protein PilF